MITRERPSLLNLLTAMRGSIIPRILGPVAFLAGFAALITALDTFLFPVPHFETATFTVLGIGLSLFLGFRNNAAYDRWWEARNLWGGLLADVRSLARELEIFISDPATKTALLRDAGTFLEAHKKHLRWMSGDTGGKPHVMPCQVLNTMTNRLSQARASGEIDGFGALQLTQRLGQMAQKQAGSERIANTPLPFVYSLLIYRTTYIYCLLLPLGLIAVAGWATPLFVALVGYMFLGLAEVSEDLGRPFARTPNAVALDAIQRAAEISLAAHLGETPPPPLLPDHYYLS